MPVLTNDENYRVYRSKTGGYTNNPEEAYEGIQQDGEGNYLLGCLSDWQDFAEIVNSGTNPAANAKMTADIDLGDDQTILGTTTDLAYKGTFDGQGHTLTVNISSSVESFAPFRYVGNGSAIQNLRIAGTVNGANRRVGGFVGEGYGTYSISNCISSVTINTTYNGDGIQGGFVASQRGTCQITDCIFDGVFYGPNAYTWGGIVGWDYGSTSISNCLVICDSYTINTSYVATFIPNGNNITNCYYKTAIGTAQGTQATTEQLADGTTAYKLQNNREDLVWGQRIGVDAEPVLTSDESYRVYRSKNGGYTNDPDLAYTGLVQDAEDYYLLGSLLDWQEFAALVQSTPTANARMTADIDLGNDQTTIGHPNENPSYHFKGIFDGNGHTLTVHYVKQGEKDICSPFPNISEATIKNIHITGTIESSTACQPAVIGCVRYGTTTIQNVWSSVELISTKTSWCEASGLVGCVDGYKNGHLVMTDCMVSGNIISYGSYEGCFIGYINSGGSATVTNCLSIANFTYNGTSGFMGNYTNCYVKQFPSSIPAAMQVTNDDLADGTTASALQNSRPETIWVQDPVLNQPMLKIFANYVNHVTGYGDSEESDHWVFIASPVAGNLLPTAVENIVAATATNYDLYRFNQSGENGEWENYKAHTDGFVLENGKGYLYANKNDVDLTFAGVLNMSASMDVALDYDDGAYLAGFNLVGNPFTDEATINMPFYKMNNDGSDVVAVENYNEEAIPALTGVVVGATDEGQHVTFTKAGAKSRGNSDSQGSLQMTLTKSGVRGNAFHDKAIISFNESAQLGKYIFNENHAKLYIPQDGNDYAIAFSNHQGEVPVHFVAKETGRYTISVETHDRASLQWVKLIDKFENVVIDLGIENSYTFIGTPADSRDRFIIRFENTENSENPTFAYQNGSDIIVSGEGELQVFDVMGRLVSQQYVNGIEIIAKPSQTGVYIMRLNEKTQKIVIK